MTAGKFQAQFASSDGRNHLTSVHGAPDARIVNSTPGQPDRVSTSDSVDAAFLPQGGIDSITQQGNVAYTDGQPPDKRMQAWADSAHYTPADQMLRPHWKSARRQRRHGDHGQDDPHQPRHRRRSGRRRRQEHLQRTEGATGRCAAGFFFADSRHRAQHDCPQQSGHGPLHGKRAPLAGRQHHRGAHHPVRPRPPIRDRPGHARPARANDSGSGRKSPSRSGHKRAAVREQAQETAAKTIAEKESGKGSSAVRIEPHLHHRARSSPTPIPSAESTTKAASSPKVPSLPPPPRRSTPTCCPAVKPRTINRLPVPGSSTTWSPKAMS